MPNHPEAVPQVFAYSTGQQMLRELSWEELEDSVVDLIDRTVNKEGGDFDPERDVADWKINRWSYGYAHELSSVFDPSLYGAVEDQPQVRGPPAVPQHRDRGLRLRGVRVHALPRSTRPTGRCRTSPSS